MHYLSINFPNLTTLFHQFEKKNFSSFIFLNPPPLTRVTHLLFLCTFRTTSESITIFASTIKHDWQHSRRRARPITFVIFCPLYFSFFLMIQVSFFYHLISAEKPLSGYSFRVNPPRLATDSYFFSKKLVPPSSNWTVFFFHHLENILACVYGLVSDERVMRAYTHT